MTLSHVYILTAFKLYTVKMEFIRRVKRPSFNLPIDIFSLNLIYGLHILKYEYSLQSVKQFYESIYIMKNPWKFESSEKLSSKISNGSSSPIIPNKYDSFPPPHRIQVGSFGLQTQEKPMQKVRRSKGAAAKTKAKAQEQLRSIYKQLQERQGDLESIVIQTQTINQALKERKRAGEDIVNNQQMLQFKEKQLNNLMTIHAELLESAKRDIQNEKTIKFSHDEKIVALKKRITDYHTRAIERKHLKNAVQALTQEKARLEEQLKSKKETEAKKNEIRSQAIRDLLQQLVKKNRRDLQEQCQKKVKIIRDISNNVKNSSDLRALLQRKGVSSNDYYTFTQQKYVPQLNFRANPESQKIMRIFQKEVNPKIPEIIQNFQEPEESIRLKEELAGLQKSKIEKEAQVKKKQAELDRLEQQKAKLKKVIGQLKVKTQIK